MVIIEKMSKEKITVSFSGIVGRKGLSSIKKYIEFLEASGIPSAQETQASTIKKLSEDVSKSAWDKFRKKHSI